MNNLITLKILNKLLEDTRLQKLKWENLYNTSVILRPLRQEKDSIVDSINRQVEPYKYVSWSEVDMEHSYVAKVTDGAFFLVSVGDQFNLELRIQEQDKEYSELVASTATVIPLDILSKLKELYNLIRFSEYGADNSDFLNNFFNS